MMKNFRIRYVHTVGGEKPDQRTAYESRQLDLLASDKISHDGQLQGILQKLPWESRIFHKPCWNIHLGLSAKSEVQPVAKKLTSKGILWTRIASENKKWISLFRRENFTPLIEMINFEINLNRRFPTLPDFSTIRPATPKDIPQLEALAQCLFTFDRFHQDSKIPSRYSNAAHMEWIKNSVLKKTADLTLVAISKGVIAGFHAVKWINVFKQRVGMTVLIGVSPKFKGKGIGRTLLGHGLNVLKDGKAKKAWVRTEAKNSAANHLYSSFGFHETNRFWYLRRINS